MTKASRSEFPYAETTAVKLLSEGLASAAAERGLSMRSVARELGYKAQVVISHMAAGRVPIPLDRAVEIAHVVGLDTQRFFLAVLEQRHPEAMRMLELSGPLSSSSDRFVAELEDIAGCGLSELPEEHKSVLREAVSERHPRRRWLSLAELPVLAALRRQKPGLTHVGMSPAELERITAAID